MRCGFFTKTDDARNKGSVPKRKSAFHDYLLLIQRDDRRIGPLLRIQQVRTDDEGSPASCFLSQGLVIERHLCLSTLWGDTSFAGRPRCACLVMTCTCT